MSEKIYGFKDDKCKVEVPSKEEFDQLENKTKNIEVIRGLLEVPANSGKNLTINYPSGYTSKNCVPIACGIKYSTKGFNFVGQFEDSMDMYWNAYKRTLTLGDQNITLRVENPSTESAYTFNFIIVLMKIHTEEFTLGDVNGDGKINSTDLQMVQDFIMGNITLTDRQFLAADINQDGEVTTRDAQLIEEMIANEEAE